MGLLRGGLYGLIAYGLTIIWAVLRVVNYAQGDFIVLAGFLSITLFAMLGIDPLLSIFITAPFMFILGFIITRYMLLRVSNPELHTSFLATVGISLIIEDAILLIWGPFEKSIITEYYAAGVYIGPIQMVFVNVEAFVVSTAVVFGIYVLLKRTDYGRAIRAVSENPTASSILGVNVSRIASLAFGTGLFANALAGAMFPLIQPVGPTSGLTVLALAFSISVMVMATNNLMYSYVGGLIIGVGEAASRLILPPGYEICIAPAILIVLLLYLGQRRRLA